MSAQQFAIEIDLRHRPGGFKAQKVAPPGLRFPRIQVAAIPARFAQVILPSLRLFPAPIVRQGNRRPVGRVVIGPLRSASIALLEPPVGLEKRVFAPGGVEKTGCKNADDGEKNK